MLQELISAVVVAHSASLYCWLHLFWLVDLQYIRRGEASLVYVIANHTIRAAIMLLWIISILLSHSLLLVWQTNFVRCNSFSLGPVAPVLQHASCALQFMSCESSVGLHLWSLSLSLFVICMLLNQASGQQFQQSQLLFSL